MAKNKPEIPSVIDVSRQLRKGSLKPVYYLFGEDVFGINSTLELIDKAISPVIESDFDKEFYYGEDKTVQQIISAANAYPFGSSKKLLVVKEFDKVKEKKNLVSYISAPSETTIMVLIQYGGISNYAIEPFKSLVSSGYIYESRELKGNNLIEWLIDYAETRGKFISNSNADYLINLLGGNRTLLESNLEKLFVFLGDKKEVDINVIKSLTVSLKQNTIFDLQNAVGNRNEALALKVLHNLLDNGVEPTVIVFMLVRYFTAIAKLIELSRGSIQPAEIAKKIEVPYFTLNDYNSAVKNFSAGQVLEAANALFKAEKTLKTTSSDIKTTLTILLYEIFHGEQ
ncbi:MAG: DNA polymerase III subunit delta [Ignavibacteriaceae bacterium]|nr:DNA polymerase III subunit delta [Ignavibacteriaceae bacterium]